MTLRNTVKNSVMEFITSLAYMLAGWFAPIVAGVELMSVFEHGAAEGNKKPPVGFAPDSSGFSYLAVFETGPHRHSFSNPVNGVNVTPKAEESQKVIGSRNGNGGLGKKMIGTFFMRSGGGGVVPR
jgi:hypothetical protein